MQTKNKGVCAGLLLMASLAMAAPASAADVADDWVPVAEALLDEARGGFDLGSGLLMSLGIERTVAINGNVVSSSSFNIADVSRLSTEEAGRASAAMASLNLLQSGPGNTFLPGSLAQTLGGTVIQNSLNDQVLQTRTIINTSVNSLALLKTMNFQDSLGVALNHAAGAK